MTSEGWTYQLTDEDARLASALAARRDEGKPESGGPPRQRSPRRGKRRRGRGVGRSST